MKSLIKREMTINILDYFITKNRIRYKPTKALSFLRTISNHCYDCFTW